MEKPLKNAPDLRRKQFAPGVELTPMMREYVLAMVRMGFKPHDAARHAGYSSPKNSVPWLMSNPAILQAIQIERQRYISGEIANIATGTLVAIMQDRKAPAAARVSAARTVLEMSGDLRKGKDGDDRDKPLSEMTAEQLAGLIDKWTEEKAALAKEIPAEDVEIVDSAQDRAQLRPESPSGP